jgi:hypothetical protein
MTTSTPPTDAVDIASLWVNVDGGDPLAVEHVHKIPIGRPKDFCRVHPSADFRRRCVIYKHKTENMLREEYYLVGPSMQGRIEEARPCTLVVAVDRAMMPRVWPLILPRDDENDNDAWVTSRVIAREATACWVKPMWKDRHFVSRQAEEGYAPDPDFSNLPPFDEIIRIAFGPHGIINDDQHPIARALLGLPATPGTDDLDAEPL